MFARSIHNTSKISSGEVLVLSQRSYRPSDPFWRVLVAVPKTYEDLVALAKHVFCIDEEDDVLFFTEDLDLCDNDQVSIHCSSWEFIRLAVRSVVVESRSPYLLDSAGYLADVESDADSSSLDDSDSEMDMESPGITVKTVSAHYILR
ncbi:unnamed protein product [Peniophora sp. CBMAI 1063]|nr:unnamed protein product [Peniophora sp. CBMAI 1063]